MGKFDLLKFHFDVTIFVDGPPFAVGFSSRKFYRLIADRAERKGRPPRILQSVRHDTHLKPTL